MMVQNPHPNPFPICAYTYCTPPSSSPYVFTKPKTAYVQGILLVVFALHLGAPDDPVLLHALAHISLELDRALVVHSVLGVVLPTVVDHELRVVEERVHVAVLVRVQFVLHRAEVYTADQEVWGEQGQLTAIWMHTSRVKREERGGERGTYP